MSLDKRIEGAVDTILRCCNSALSDNEKQSYIKQEIKNAYSLGVSGKPLEEIIEEYENLRSSFRNYISNGDGNKNALVEFEYRFVDLRADLRPWHTKMVQASEARSDKSATAIKMRIAVAMVKDEYEFKEESPMYEKAPSISNAEKFAGASKEYKEFLEQRVFWKESLINVADLREDIGAYINMIKDKLK